MENVEVEVGGERPFVEVYESVVMPDADVSKPVHPIRGSWTWATCMSMEDAGRNSGDPSLNCRETDVTQATGACWRTTFGDWQCAMNGRSGSAGQPTGAPR